MISLVQSPPEVCSRDLGFLKIKCLFDCYKDDKSVLFWRQDKGVYLSLAGGDMTVSEGGINTEEMREFISVIAPKSIFCPRKTADLLQI